MKVTFFGTTTLLFDDGKDQILFDCHFTRPSLFKYLLSSKVDSDSKLIDKIIEDHHIDRLKAIFVSHSHHDHVMDAPYMASKTKAKVYGTFSSMNVLRSKNINENQLIEFKANETYEVGDYKIKVLASIHSKPTILNNDLGEIIEKPSNNWFRLRQFKEGGSFDFVVENKNKTYLIRPSFNYIEGQLDNYKADVLFLGVAGLAKASKEMEEIFYKETIDKVEAKCVVPIHWDNFFSRLDKPIVGMPFFIERTPLVFYKLAKHCEKVNVNLILQTPLTSIEI